QERGIIRARGGEPGLDASGRLLAAEAMGNRDDERLGQFNLRRCENSYGLWAFIWATPRGRASRIKERDRSARPFRSLTCNVSRPQRAVPMLPRPVVLG